MSFNPNVCPFPTSWRKVFVSHTKLERILCFTYTPVLMWIIICCIQVCWGVHWGAHCAYSFFLRISNGKVEKSAGTVEDQQVIITCTMWVPLSCNCINIIAYYTMCTIIEDKTAFLCGFFKAWHRMGQWWYARNSMRGKGLVQYGIVVHTRLWCSRP